TSYEIKRVRHCRRIYEKKRKASEERNKTRVFLGDSFTRWRALKAQVGLPTDASVAKFLLDR
uniref:Uncharacterized protein n=1 Tax=Neogobius melanostomus TaxID=47308 RepID=A0A8C6WRP7_9GOBI